MEPERKEWTEELRECILAIMGSALAVDWTEIRKCSEAGMSDEDIASRFGIEDKTAIRMRRSREKWLTPAAIQREIIRRQAEDKCRGVSNASVTGVTKVSALDATAGILEGLRDKMPLLLAPYLAEKLGEMVKTDSLPVPKSTKDLASMVSTQWKVLGIDKPETQIAIVMPSWAASVSTQSGHAASFEEAEPEGHSLPLPDDSEAS
jgi:hypothetical protein